MKFGPISLGEAEGAILAHTVAAGERVWRKATLLTAEDIAALQAAGLTEVVAAVPEAGDLDENEAAARIATGLGAPGIEVRVTATGRANLHAVKAGVFTVDSAAVNAINAVDPAITLATLPEFATVRAGQMLATVKIIPFAVHGSLVDRVGEFTAPANNIISLHPFRPHTVGLVQTVLPSLKPSVLDKTARLTADRLRRSGSVVTSELRTAHDEAELGQVIAMLSAGNDMVIVFGASAVSDSGDVIPSAIRKAGGSVRRVGMPVDPGNLLVIGEVNGKPVIGAPGCARSPKLNGFDWVLDRMLAGLPVGDREIAGMGVGGLLMEIESRPQPREPQPKRTPHVHAVVLAAGRGQRMGGPNKLLALFGDTPLVRRVANAIAGSKARSAVVVTGHEAQQVAAALHGLNLRVVENTDYATGLASSLKTGIAALPTDAAGALVMLGDMPAVSSADINRLIDAFTRANGGAIIRATHAGKRGNPVILPRALFTAVVNLHGDIGARYIIETSDRTIIDIEIGEAASIDVDTPEAMKRAGGVLTG